MAVGDIFENDSESAITAVAAPVLSVAFAWRENRCLLWSSRPAQHNPNRIEHATLTMTTYLDDLGRWEHLVSAEQR